MKGADGMTCAEKELDSAIKRIGDGDKSALAELYKLVAAQAYGYSLSLLHSVSDAEDVISELLLEIWRCAPDYRSMGKPTAWVIGIARNLCRMKLRQRQRFSAEDIDEADLADERLGVEDRAVIKACFWRLGEREREVVIMHAVVGLKFREIAEILDEPISTAISRYHGAIKKLKKELEGAL